MAFFGSTSVTCTASVIKWVLNMKIRSRKSLKSWFQLLKMSTFVWIRWYLCGGSAQCYSLLRYEERVRVWRHPLTWNLTWICGIVSLLAPCYVTSGCLPCAEMQSSQRDGDRQTSKPKHGFYQCTGVATMDRGRRAWGWSWSRGRFSNTVHPRI